MAGETSSSDQPNSQLERAFILQELADLFRENDAVMAVGETTYRGLAAVTANAAETGLAADTWIVVRSLRWARQHIQRRRQTGSDI